MRNKIRDAFLNVREGWSVDRVIADPLLNQRFIANCRNEGLMDDPSQLNLTLMNLRKKGDLRGINSKRPKLKNDDDYRFAAEMAIRHLEEKYAISLDAVLCDPAKAAEFDSLASDLAPGFSSLEYRWAALKLRKTSRLKPEIASRLLRSTSISTVAVNELDVKSIPTEQGLYIFYTAETTLYVGESENLQSRLRKHLDHSDNKELARWLWSRGASGLHVEYRVLPTAVSMSQRRALELSLIQTRNPKFNSRGVKRGERQK